MSARLGTITLVFLGIAACAPPDWVGDAPPQAEAPTADTPSTNEGATTRGVCVASGPSGASSPTPCEPAPTAPSSEPASPGSVTDAGSDSADSASTAPSGDPTSCCEGKGKCVATKSIDDDDRDHLERKECAEAKLCVPLEHLDDDFEPESCTGQLVVGSYKGVCLNNCLSFAFVAEIATVQGSCDSNHRCVPCRTAFGIPTGAPGCE